METKQFEINFKHLTTSLNKLSFKSRQRHILHRLSDIIHVLNAPRETTQRFQGIAMSSGPGLQIQQTRKRPRSLSVVGGKKKYKGSPRRRTLRKTRKHR